MEPLNGVARFNEAGDRVEVWEGTQAPDSSRQRIARALGFEPSQVIHHQQYMGGGFGRRTITDYTIEAALIARAVKKPVKMIWTREEDIAYGMFRPQTFQSVEAAMDKDGKVSGWRHCVVGDGGSLTYSGIKLDRYYRDPEPGHRAARRVARHPPQALAGGRASLQPVRHRRRWSTRWPRRKASTRSRSDASGWA